MQYAAERSVTLPVALVDAGKLNHAAMRALDVIYRPRHEYKKAGVMLLNLAAADTVQDSLFDAPNDPKAIARQRALDSLNAKYGQGR